MGVWFSEEPIVPTLIIVPIPPQQAAVVYCKLEVACPANSAEQRAVGNLGLRVGYERKYPEKENSPAYSKTWRLKMRS